MDIRLFKKIIDECVAVSPNGDAGYGAGTIWLHLYGESLLSPIFDEAVAYTRHKGLKPMLSINPLALTPEKMKRLLYAGPYLLYLMMDGKDEESFSNIRGVKSGVKNQFEKSMANALAFLALKTALKSDVRVFIVSVAIPGQEKIIDEARRFWEARTDIEGYVTKHFIDWNGSIPEITSLAESMPPYKCVNPWHTMAVTWDGIVLPCCFDFDHFYPLGDANKDSLTNIWNGERAQSLRREFAGGSITNALCRTCNGGGLETPAKRT